ncbi:MAG: glutamate 5-kinase [Thermoplasmata archaeon]|nr:glutamate 5-kinase [Thermoplasmata archaeon]
MDRRTALKDATRVVVKIGSSSIVRPKSISRDFMDSVAEQVGRLRAEGKEVLVVSSGAIAIGLKAMKVTPKPKEIPIRQAAASVGQGILMKEWGDCFSRHGMIVGQVLLTMDDYSVRDQAVSLNNTIESLLENGVVPIFNENDAISDYEIRFGDNDTLSAIVASRTDADLLIILSDVAGLYDADPTSHPDAKLVPEVDDIDSIRHMAGKSVSGVGTGGMKTKLDAAEICRDAGCLMVIALSSADDVVYKAATGEDIGTVFLTSPGISKKRRWIKSAHPSGTLVVDEGAGRAVLDHRSLLPVGIREVRGRFDAGDVVEIVCGSESIAKGIVGYDSSDLARIAGKRSAEIEGILGHKGHDDAVLSENIALL